jgi:hypothetical protein
VDPGSLAALRASQRGRRGHAQMRNCVESASATPWRAERPDLGKNSRKNFL